MNFIQFCFKEAENGLEVDSPVILDKSHSVNSPVNAETRDALKSKTDNNDDNDNNDNEKMSNNTESALRKLKCSTGKIRKPFTPGVFKCDICGLVTTKKGSLTVHMRLHDREL